ncbi:beta-lactamase family protein [Stakelama sp. CBK3Z-3]|uniref:Beta-lactamase family protein n=2 Tax=Stakelama flava TaxID=2860338 RepID=A0ABS6XQS5_9SPHN|nr:beta-lactamase family protein [Stakelama flava]
MAVALALACAATTASAQQGPLVPKPAVDASAGKGEPVQPAGGAAALTRQDVDAWLDGFVPFALQSGDIAGAVVVVVKDGQVLTERGFGYADVAKRTPVDPRRTLFRPGSVSKLVTWTAVMQLVEQGKIDLDADINRYIDFRIPPLDGKPVTMRELMQHTAGFEEQVKGIIVRVPATSPGYEALLKRWVPTRIFTPGTTPAYSNYGASLAGYVVERVSGEPFADYVEQHIFAPLGMRHSTFRQPLPDRLKPLMSKGYTRASADPGGYELVGPAPAGSLASTGDDMARFMIAQLQQGRLGGARILSATTAEQMHNSPFTLIPPLNRMELGFFETNVNGREVIGHLGDTDDFHTSLHLFLKDGVGLYASFNSAGKDGAVQPLRHALFLDFADRYFPGGSDAAIPAAGTDKRHSQLMAGKWIGSRRSESNFLKIGELLGQTDVIAGPDGSLSIPSLGELAGNLGSWKEIAPFVWLAPNGNDRLAAKLVDGKPVRFSMDVVSPFMVFDRVPWYANTTWVRPALYLSLAILLLTAVLWPVRAIIRRRFGGSLALDRRAMQAYRASRIGALLLAAAVIGWIVTISAMFSATNNLSASFDPIVWIMEIFATLAIVGGFGLVAWNAWQVWREPRRWTARTWSVVLVLAAFMVLWVGLVFNMIGLGVNY